MATQTIIPGSRTTAGAIKDGPNAREKSIYLDPDQMRRAEYTVYLHSISKRSFEQPHPIYRNVVIPACPKDKRYITFMLITHPVQIATVDPDNVSGPLKWFFENAKRCRSLHLQSQLCRQRLGCAGQGNREPVSDRLQREQSHPAGCVCLAERDSDRGGTEEGRGTAHGLLQAHLRGDERSFPRRSENSTGTARN